MTRKILLVAVCVTLLAAASFILVSAQEEKSHIVTTTNEVVGLGTYVAHQVFAEPAGADPEEAPVKVHVLSYAIYPDDALTDLADFVQPEPLVEGFTYEWSLIAPEDSAAELMLGEVVFFMPDVQGRYDLTVVATHTETGNSAEFTKAVYATTYVGNGDIDPTDMQCGYCHDDVVESWLETGHSDMLIRALDGTLSSHYRADCINCHTTGFNDGENGGFDDLMAEYGWEFPVDEEGHALLGEGGYEAFAAEYPEVAALANIQCESCHGPGYLHVMEATRRESMISVDLSNATCGSCHAEETHHVYPQQWENSGHADLTSRAFTYPIDEGHEACVRCHSGVGYIDYADGEDQEDARLDYQPITCAVCHDPHDATNPHQLRIVDTATMPYADPNSEEGAPMVFDDVGASATCMSCHNVAFGNPTAVVLGAVEGGRFSTPHYSPVTEFMSSTGGYTWGETLPSSGHGTAIEDSCVTCHMGPTPGFDDMGTPDDSNDDQPLPGRHEIGGHSFSVYSEAGGDNVVVCEGCHIGVTSFEFEAARDYDGDGTYESNQAEVEGLQDILTASLEEAGVVVLGHYPYFEYPEDAGEDIYGAVWNLKISQGSASAVHNLRYTVGLLQLSIDKLGGTYGDSLSAR